MMPAAPLPRSDRLVGLDVLRGVALFGIVVVNVGAFRGETIALVDRARFDSVADRVAELASAWLAQGKFFPMFSFLFGYGVAVQLQRRPHGGWGPPMARRLVAVGVFGVVHGVAFFWGDILLTYALAGALLLAFAGCRERTLLRWAVALLAGSALLGALVFTGLDVLTWVDGPSAIVADAQRSASRFDSPSFLTVTGERAALFSYVTVAQFFVGSFTTVLGMMLLGLAAGRRGLLSAVAENRALLLRLRRWGLAVGLSVCGLATAVGFVLGFGEQEPEGLVIVAELVSLLAGALAAPVLTLGYLASIALVRSRQAGRALSLLAPAGRMALTCYLGQSLVLSLLFSGYGLGWYGDVGPAAGLGLCLLLYPVQVALATAWLRWFALGPVEWVLRSITYARVQPLRAAAGDGRR